MSSWYKGYGRGWGEEKAHGLARIAQIMREPAGHGTYIVGGVVMLLTFMGLVLHG